MRLRCRKYAQHLYAVLPPGTIAISLAQLEDALAFSERRVELLHNLRDYMTVNPLCAVSRELWIDGSFAETKLDPRDLDAAFLLDTSRYRGNVPDLLAYMNTTGAQEASEGLSLDLHFILPDGFLGPNDDPTAVERDFVLGLFRQTRPNFLEKGYIVVSL